ncbi:hypothetical protein LTR78_001515 [Recurvomyces mirabilis]|uniref:Uncharacterized protein n=1 Tax=Recurvomyces mirabilis TaxID=574656 RepID=A0AAE0WWH1_9PEZI|nr:hypothetical protein LTR78_001515 [Recurvomyces mirabilis]KAK5161494.1 hypothetical protein LTS14_001290 [Recurvomyces mirabilis]
MSVSPTATSDPFVDTNSNFTAINGTNREALREEHTKNFDNYYIDDTIVREPYVEPSPKVKKTRGKKRAADVSDPSDKNAEPSKKMKIATKETSSSSAEGDVTSEETQVRRSGRSTAGQKRKADDFATEQPITPESPLAKKSKPSANATSKVGGKAVDMEPVTPPRKRPASITRTLRTERKYPKTRTPSLQLAKKTEVTLADDSDAELKAESLEPSDAEESAVKSSRASGKQTPCKKEVKSAVPSDYKGIATSLGTTSEKPDNAPLDHPWACANRACCSGMTWYHRESKGSDGFGRKTISQFFGRNKKETHRIDGDVWHTYCRKDYQRMYYKAIRAEGGEYKWHMDNLNQQFIRLKLWRPEATFTVGLSKKMGEKASEWHRILRKHKSDKGAAKVEFDKHKTWGVKEAKVSKRKTVKTSTPEDSFPVDFVDQFSATCCKSDVDYDGIEDTMHYLQDLYDDETLMHMPPIEFLISDVKKGETVNDPKKNYQLWIDEMENETPSEAEADGAEEAEDGAAAEKADSGEEIKVEPTASEVEPTASEVEPTASDDEGSDIRVAAPLSQIRNDPDFFGHLQELTAKFAAASKHAHHDDEDDSAASEADQSDDEAEEIIISQARRPSHTEYSTSSIVNSIEQSVPAPAPLPLYTPPKPIVKKPFKLTPVDPTGRYERLSTTLGSKPGNGRTPPVVDRIVKH